MKSRAPSTRRRKRSSAARRSRSTARNRSSFAAPAGPSLALGSAADRREASDPGSEAPATAWGSGAPARERDQSPALPIWLLQRVGEHYPPGSRERDGTVDTTSNVPHTSGR